MSILLKFERYLKTKKLILKCVTSTNSIFLTKDFFIEHIASIVRYTSLP